MDDDTSLTDDRLRLLLRVLPPVARARRARRADGEVAGRPEHGADRAGVPRARADDGSAAAARARRKVAHARIPFRVPPDELLDERMRGVLAVVYLVFTEGHTASDGDALTRPDLCAEAIRLGRLLCELMPDDAEAHGLLALMLFTEARRAARTGPRRPIDLRDQDRRLWDRDAIAEATGLLERSLRLREPGPYALQAGIALCHDRARSFAATDWGWIASLYGELQPPQPTPVVAVNRAVAVSFARTPEAGLELLDELRDERALRDYVPLLAARADLLRRAGDLEAADVAYAEAIRVQRQRGAARRSQPTPAALPALSRVSFPGHASLEISSPGTLSNVLPTTLPRSRTAGPVVGRQHEARAVQRLADRRLLGPLAPAVVARHRRVAPITCRWRSMSWCSMS